MLFQNDDGASAILDGSLPAWKVIAITLLLALAGTLIYVVLWRVYMRLFSEKTASPPDDARR